MEMREAVVLAREKSPQRESGRTVSREGFQGGMDGLMFCSMKYKVRVSCKS